MYSLNRKIDDIVVYRLVLERTDGSTADWAPSRPFAYEARMFDRRVAKFFADRDRDTRGKVLASLKSTSGMQPAGTDKQDIDQVIIDAAKIINATVRTPIRAYHIERRSLLRDRGEFRIITERVFSVDASKLVGAGR
jgi:hypothetical protein